jgi:tetratricopeptide (TPR) repeat protein
MKRIIGFILVLIFVAFLTACGRYDIQVDIPPEERAQTEMQIEELKSAIKNYVPQEGEIAWREMIQLAEAYESLGYMSKAIKVYTDVLDTGKKTKAIINNLGRLYEKVGEYDLAVAQYQRIVDEYFDTSYLYDITWAYISAAQNSEGDEKVSYRKEAEKYFNAWQLEFRKTDEQTQQAIKKLRDQEKSD